MVFPPDEHAGHADKTIVAHFAPGRKTDESGVSLDKSMGMLIEYP